MISPPARDAPVREKFKGKIFRRKRTGRRLRAGRENRLKANRTPQMRLAAHITLGLLLAAAFSNSACRKGAQSKTRATVIAASAPPAETRWDDSDRDGIPDGAELRAYGDRENFRRWFTSIAELQFYRASAAWNEGQRDCAGLVRFAWRESLRPHDRAWFRKMGAEYDAVAPDVRAYSLERGPLQERIFRTSFGSFEESDLNGETFSEFADARTLKEFNTEFVSRERKEARPGAPTTGTFSASIGSKY
jgi:uncharacterized protein YfaT (DUF1175 family)